MHMHSTFPQQKQHCWAMRLLNGGPKFIVDGAPFRPALMAEGRRNAFRQKKTTTSTNNFGSGLRRRPRDFDIVLPTDASTWRM